jgi:biotin operon repressor
MVSMSNKDKIIKLLQKEQVVKSIELSKKLGLSRQKVTKHLATLVREGKVNRSGSTRGASYQIAIKKKKNTLISKIELIKKLKGLQEDIVFKEVELRLPTLQKLPQNVGHIIFYAFGEMLNNAIDHSASKSSKILVCIDTENFFFRVKDFGIGIFANVKKTFKLNNEFEALEHILKGKQTTYPERHSGQGIFFTSKIADIFIIKSHNIELTVDNISQDIRVKSIKKVLGTEVYFQIKRRSRKVLKNLFVQFSSDEYEFDRTSVKVKLTAERELLARSQAKRILSGTEEYNIITLDFEKVKEVGQGFIDEVFRVFKSRHPHIQIIYINANPSVKFMIQRQNKKGR